MNRKPCGKLAFNSSFAGKAYMIKICAFLLVLCFALVKPNIARSDVFEAREEEAYILDLSDAETDAAVSRDISPDPIKEQDHPPSNVAGIDLPGYYPNTFTIHLATSIGRVDRYVTSDNVLVLDFYNAGNQLQDQYEVNHPAVERLRVGTFADGSATRLAFDLTSVVDFYITLTEDRRTLSVVFVKNNIQNVRFNSEGAADVVRITGDYPPVIIFRPAENAHIVSIDIPFASINLPAKWVPSLNFIKSIDTKQIDEHTVRITMETFADASMDISYEGDTALVKLSPATYRNISYAGKAVKLRKDSLYPVNINAITERDEYNSYRYVITLDGNYQGWLGWGRYYVNDDYIKNIEIGVNTYGERQLIVNEKQVLAFDISQDTEYIYIKAMAPREKYDRIVIIDPGHGGSDPGATGNGVTEKILNMDTANRVMALFEQSGSIKAYATRRTDVLIDLYERPRWANAIGDLFVSIHNNAMGSRNTAANGTETYYYPHSNDATLGFSGMTLATLLQNNLLTALGSTDRGVKSARFVVIRNTTIPSALVEIGFVTNPTEASLLATESYRQKAAQAIYDSVVEAFARYTPKR